MIISWKIVSLSYSAQDDSPLVYVKRRIWRKHNFSQLCLPRKKQKGSVAGIQGRLTQWISLFNPKCRQLDVWLLNETRRAYLSSFWNLCRMLKRICKGVMNHDVDRKTLASWWRHLGRYIKQMSPEEAARKQVKYLNDIKKSKKLTIWKWNRLICNINLNKNICKYPKHPNSKHEWKDCIYNNQSKNYCVQNGRVTISEKKRTIISVELPNHEGQHTYKRGKNQ